MNEEFVAVAFCMWVLFLPLIITWFEDWFKRWVG